MRPEDIEKFNRFLAELRQESDRGLALVGAAFIDEKLAQTLTSFFCTEADELLFGKNAPMGSFWARTQCCHALGLIDDTERNDCHYVREVRNEFAHNVDTVSFSKGRVRDLCQNFPAQLPEPDMKPSPRFRFENAVISLASRLFYRPEYVAREKREPKVWVKAEDVRWRRTSEEPPPADKPVLAHWMPEKPDG